LRPGALSSYGSTGFNSYSPTMEAATAPAPVTPPAPALAASSAAAAAAAAAAFARCRLSFLPVRCAMVQRHKLHFEKQKA
jgi:hypothetical protein